MITTRSQIKHRKKENKMKRSLSFQDDKPLLYLVATPIGNLKEFSPRAIETLQNADIIACEDTRNTAKLLSFFKIDKKLISLREHNEVSASLEVVRLLRGGVRVAYVSDAGFPAISDPGEILVQKCLESDINVSVIGGSNALLVALVASGLSTEHFYFHGFLKAKKNEREKELTKLKDKDETLIFYESPHRIIETLKSMLELFGDRKAVIARELTKMHEEYIRANLSVLIDIDGNSLKGEMVIVVEGNPYLEREITDEEILTEYKETDSKLTTKDRIDLVTRILNIKRNRVYNVVIKKEIRT